MITLCRPARFLRYSGWLALFAAAIPVAFGQQAISADAIFGFESLAAWQVNSSSASSVATLTNLRTQGAAALSLVNPGSSTKFTSAPVAFDAPQLAKIGVLGASLAVDIRFPLVPLPNNAGSLRLTIIPSNGNKIQIGSVDFTKTRPGSYQTISFPITDQIRRSLPGSGSLSFEFAMTVPASGGNGAFFCRQPSRSRGASQRSGQKYYNTPWIRRFG